MKSISIRVMVLFAAVVISAQCLQAVPIKFIHEGRGSAILDGSSLGEVDFVITAYGDTDDRVEPIVTVWKIPHTSASISFPSDRVILTFDFLANTTTFLNTSQVDKPTVGFQFFDPDAGLGGDLFNGPRRSPGLSGWEMLTSIGPVSGQGEIITSAWNGVMTTGGSLHFEGSGFEDSPATFTAIIVPEPATLLLLGLGAAMVRRRR